MPSDESKKLLLVGISPIRDPEEGGQIVIGQNDNVQQHSSLVNGAVARVLTSLDISAVSKKIAEQLSLISEMMDLSIKSSPLGFPLAEVQVSLAVTASGSVGIVSAGTQGSFTLIFRAPSSDSKSSDFSKQ